MNSGGAESLNLFLCGDVMTGRGIDQILPHPESPALHEPFVSDARTYLELAEKANGRIERSVSPDYIWGDALDELRHAQPDVRIINLETSITTSDDFWPRKKIHYRMQPRNIGCLTAARIDCCCLANNHVLDWGYAGLRETLATLDAAGLRHAGAGTCVAEAQAPVAIDCAGKARVLVFAVGSSTSGIPLEWSATENRLGVNLLDDLSEHTARSVGALVREARKAGDVVVVSIHWGSNWGYEITAEQRHFGRRLIEEGVAIVHGHSSHHVRPIELYGGGLILYGCGDFINDYEGIGGYANFRDDLTLMYFIKVDPRKDQLLEVRLVPMRIRHLRLERASAEDAAWLCELLNSLGTPVRLEADQTMTLRLG